MKKSVIIGFLVLLSVSVFAQKIYVVNSGSSTLSEVDLGEGTIDNSFASLGSMANRVALTEDKAYVVNSGDNTVQVIDLGDGSTEDTIYLGVSVNPYDIILHDGYAYVTGGINNTLIKINLSTNEVVETIVVGGNPAGMAVANGNIYVGNTDYASGYGNCTVSVVDIATFTETETVPVSANPQYLVVAGGTLHVICGGNWVDITGVVDVIDLVDHQIVESIELGGIPGSAAYFQGKIYLGDSMNTAVYAYDVETYDLIYTPASPFTPGGSSLCSNEEFLGVLGGNWGENFALNIYDANENNLFQFTAGLTGTDVKFAVETTASNETTVPQKVILTNYPNPFKPSQAGRGSSTRIIYQTNDMTGSPMVEIYNSRGQSITMLNMQQSDDKFVADWDGKDSSNRSVSSGIYFYKISGDKTNNIKKMLLMK